MLYANGYLDIFMLPMGFYIHNQLFELLSHTGLLWLPFLIVAVQAVIEARLNGIKGEEALDVVLTTIETRYFIMIVVIMVAVAPTEMAGSTNPKKIDYQVTSCNDKYKRVLLGEDVETLREDFKYSHDLESYPTLAYGLTNLLSTASVNAVIATLPCTIGYRDVQFTANVTNLISDTNAKLVENFAKQCYIPALSAVLEDASIEYDAREQVYMDTYGLLSTNIANVFNNTDINLLMTTPNKTLPQGKKIDNWGPEAGVAFACAEALGIVRGAVESDKGWQAYLTEHASFFATEIAVHFDGKVVVPEYFKFPETYKDSQKDLAFQYLFKKVAGQSFNSDDGMKPAEADWDVRDFAEASIGLVISTIGGFIAWVLATGVAAIAVDLIPWTISILQGVVAALFILVLFFNCYSGQALKIIIGTVVALEFTLLGLEVAAWIDNVVFSVLHHKAVQDRSMTGGLRFIFLSAAMGAMIYIIIPTFTYKWLSANIGAGHGVGDVAGGATQMGQMGTFASMNLAVKGVKLLGKMGNSAGSKMVGGVKKAAQKGQSHNATLNGRD